MNQTLIVHNENRMSGLRAEGLGDWPALLNSGSMVGSGRTRSQVWRISTESSGDVFLKRSVTGVLRSLAPVRYDRASQEMAGLRGLREYGWNTPTPVASGVERRAGRRIASLLLTVGLLDHTPLPEIQEDERPEIVSQFLVRLAALHSAGAIHGDLRWRNILVGQDSFALLDCAGFRQVRGAISLGNRSRDLGLFLVDARLQLTQDQLDAAMEAYFEVQDGGRVRVMERANLVADRCMSTWKRFAGATRDELRQARADTAGVSA